MIDLRSILQHKQSDDELTRNLVEYLKGTPLWERLEREGSFFNAMRAYPNTNPSDVNNAKKAIISLCKNKYCIDFGEMCVLLIRKEISYPPEIEKVVNSFLSAIEFLYSGESKFYKQDKEELERVQKLRLEELKEYLKKVYEKLPSE